MLRRLCAGLIVAGRFSSKKPTQLNSPPVAFVENRQQMMHNGWRVPDPTHQVSQRTHLSNGEANIHRVPVIKVHTNVVRCMGGTEINAGHPIEYIQVNTKYGEPASCKYCGLRYQLAHEDHDSHHNSADQQKSHH